MQALLTFATRYAHDRYVTPDCILHRVSEPPATLTALKRAEELFRVYDLYVWLAARFTGTIQGHGAAMHRRLHCSDLIDQALRSTDMWVEGHKAKKQQHKEDRKGKRARKKAFWWDESLADDGVEEEDLNYGEEQQWQRCAA